MLGPAGGNTGTGQLVRSACSWYAHMGRVGPEHTAGPCALGQLVCRACSWHAYMGRIEKLRTDCRAISW